MPPAIAATGLSKAYRLGQREPYGALRDVVARALTSPFRRRSPSARHQTAGGREWIRALDDVSFEIAQGEIVGIIGRNGSGKSTLLKILSRITEPTAGRALVRGRVGSLLEVGTGFHPELTGRENAFVNGAILGMRRAETTRKFDEIVHFADVEQFIDTPVKFYSSGMQMRLAFAVAAHLEPEILLVDEVLAVGDLAFQRKCLGKLDDVSRAGRTVLFVSHQMNQLRRLCSRCLWLDTGRVIDAGPTHEILNRYEASFMSEAPDAVPALGSPAAFAGWTVGRSATRRHLLDHVDQAVIRFFLRLDTPIRDGHHGLALFDREGRVIWGAGTDNLVLSPGSYEIAYDLSLPLRPGAYRWQASIFDRGEFIGGGDLIPELSIVTMPLGHRLDEYAGFLNLPYRVEFRRLDDTASAAMSEAAPHVQNVMG